MEMTRKVACGNFVKRQTAESGFSHYEGSWEELEYLVNYWFIEYPYAAYTKPGYRDGVIIQQLPPDFFRSAVVDLTEETQLSASYAPRRPGEDPYVRVSAKGDKQPAKYASVVLYRHDVLEENNERETDAEWEIVAIKARTSEEEEPMDPYTMARNFLHLKGGTKGDFSAEDFAKAIIYWNHHTMCQGLPKWYRKLMTWWRK